MVMVGPDDLYNLMNECMNTWVFYDIHIAALSDLCTFQGYQLELLFCFCRHHNRRLPASLTQRLLQPVGPATAQPQSQIQCK